MAYEFEVAAVIPASPEALFAAWMSAEQHTEMTGGTAEVDPVVGGIFTAWDGFIWGTTLELDAPRRIVQTWRTSAFSASDPDSRIEVSMTAEPGGTLLRIRHSEVPDDHHDYEDGGWQENYFKPMQEYFAKR